MLIPFSPRHFQHPGTSAVSTPTPGDQWRAFMLRSTEAEERVGSRVRRTLSPFKELLRFNFNSDAFSPSPPAREPQRTKPPHSPPGFPLRPRHGPAALPLDVSQGHGLGPRRHADSVLPHPAPATHPLSPFTTHFLRSLSLRLDRSPRRSSPLRLFDHTFPGTFSLERRPRVSLLPWPETPLDKRWPSARGTRTARGAPTRAPLRLSPRSALPTCREPGVPTPPTASWNPPAASTRLALPPPAGRAPDWWKRGSLCPAPRAAPPQGGLRLLLLALPPPAHRRAASAQKFWTKSWELAARSPRRERGRLRVPSARRPVRGAGSRRSAGSRAALLRLVRELSARRCGGTGEAGFASSSVWGRTS